MKSAIKLIYGKFERIDSRKLSLFSLAFVVAFFMAHSADAVVKYHCATSLENAGADGVAKVDASKLRRAQREMAQLMIERAQLGNRDAALRSLLQRNIEQKTKEFKAQFGIELNADETKKIIGQIENRSLKRRKTAEKKEGKRRELETEVFMKWRRTKTHAGVMRAGPFINDTQFFTEKDSGLALYDMKEQNYIWIKPLTSENVTQEVTFDSKLLLTPKKDQLVIVNKDRIGVYDTNSGSFKSIPVKTNLDRGFRFVKLSRDGKNLFLAGEDGESLVYDLATLAPIFSQTQGTYPHGKGIVESPDGRYVFFVRSEGDQVLYDLTSRKQIYLPDLKTIRFHHCWDGIFSQDSKTLTLTNHNSSFLDFDITGGTLNRSKYDASGKELFTTVNGEYVIVGLDRNSSDKRTPFKILKASTGEDVTPDLSPFHAEDDPQSFTPSIWVSVEQSKLVYTETFRQLGASNPDHNYLYMVDLKSLKVSRYEYSPELYIMTIETFSPDGNSLLVRSNDGPLIEFY